MKSLSLFSMIVLILCSVQCAGQQVTPQKPNGLKKFNKAKYSELNEKNSLKYTENDTIYEIKEESSYFLELKRSIGNRFISIILTTSQTYRYERKDNLFQRCRLVLEKFMTRKEL
ncbi:hypothetical protein Q763_05365 [Flavobacterium beibuense F44-8]|uniref:Uncharacterized protein n=1 Tax=Flavobacterium beibuense F44-8 TaxID=1406840 RepID=A0A0A2LT75_9FLAO|nr:hypothetical protein Q763_05365 [Flavobacterium beibuense F44-8]